MEYDVSLTESAKGDIAHFRVRDQRIVVAGIMAHLKLEAEVQTRKKKRLRPNPVAPWQLRVGDFRVFYSIEKVKKVKVLAVGSKRGDDLFIRGNKVEL